MINDFKDPQKSPLLTPSDWFNFYGSFTSIFENIKNSYVLSDTEVAMLDTSNLNAEDVRKATFKLSPTGLVSVLRNNPLDLSTNYPVTKFMLLAAVKYKGDLAAAQSYVYYELMKSEVPYIRVGTDYYKVFEKTDRYGAKQTMLKFWKKDEIKEDHTKALIPKIYKFDDFTIYPDNNNYARVKENCYNLYSKFPHLPHSSTCNESQIQITLGVLKHIFGEQLDLGLKYMKVLYEHPRQILPVLSLVSVERETGKTTFLNWMQMIFGDNSVLISPSDLINSFNSGYATKNIIMIDETTLEKSTSVEKLKSIATAKSISVSQKFVQQYSIPFFGKIIICTNKEEDFMRIDKEEIRFWVRKISTITGQKNTNIEQDLFNEIPYFLKYLKQLPEIDFTQSRMVFTHQEIGTKQLTVIKKESRSGAHKEILEHLETYFHNTREQSFDATPTDIKARWFPHDSRISINYIRRVLKNELNLIPEMKRYSPFNENINLTTVGRTFTFSRDLVEDL